jgi:uncharacterized phage-associated protein
MYKSLLVGRKILELAKRDEKTLTPMQLIKLVYLSHGWMLGLYNKPLILENIEAWKFGPVIPPLYHAIKQYRSLPVKQIDEKDSNLDENSQDIINQVYKKYGHLSGITLSMLTHEKESPWEKAWNSGNTIISNDIIMEYYQGLAKANEKSNTK